MRDLTPDAVFMESWAASSAKLPITGMHTAG